MYNFIGDQNGNRPSHDAAYHNKLDCLKLLLKTGQATISDVDLKGRNILHKVQYNIVTYIVHTYRLYWGMLYCVCIGY